MISHDEYRYDGSKGKQAHATHSHGSRTQRPDSILDRRGATDASGRDPLGLSLSPTSPSKRSHASSMSPDAAHGASHGAAHGASLVLPEGFTNGRIFWSRCEQCVCWARWPLHLFCLKTSCSCLAYHPAKVHCTTLELSCGLQRTHLQGVHGKETICSQR